MAATPPATLIDVVVLVFARSELKNLVGTDALRTVLNGSQRALFPEPGVMSLEPVWELIESQPGFEADKAVPPMCRLKTWEGQLKVKVEMPSALAELDMAARANKAMECNVGDDDLYKVLKVTGAQPPIEKKDVARAIETSSASSPQRKTGSSLSTKLAAIFAVLGLVAAGVSIYLTVGRKSGDTVKLSATELTTEIPLQDVRRNGALIVATLTDLTWLDKPELERRQQLEAAAPKVRAQQATGLMLFDSKGILLATLRVDKKPPVAFPPRKQ
jgi:hypothetical protein